MVIIDFIQTIIDAIGNVGSGFLDAISGFVGGLGDLSSGSSVIPELPEPEVPVDPELPVDPEVPGDDAPVDETPVDPEVPGDDTPVEPEVPVEDAPVDENPEVDAEV